MFHSSSKVSISGTVDLESAKAENEEKIKDILIKL